MGKHTTKITFTDNSAQVLDQLRMNCKSAAKAMGIKAVNLIVDQMEHGYHTPHANRKHSKDEKFRGKKTMNVFGVKLMSSEYKAWLTGGGTHTAIRDTSALEGDVTYEVIGGGKNYGVKVGNTLEYAVPVHEGTSKLEGRPYIKDAIEKGADDLKTVAEAYLKQGF